VVIHQAPETVINANGMVYNKKMKTLELQSRVKAHYVNPAKTKPAAAKPAPAKKAPARSASKPDSKAKTTAKPNNQAGQAAKPANNSTRIRRTYEPASP
jgi:lipopolysaccharide export system protein LptC